MVFTRERSRGPGERVTAELPVSSSQHSRKGMVKMPARLVPTVSSSASAALPPTACSGQHDIRQSQHDHMQISRSSTWKGRLGAESCRAAHGGQQAQHTEVVKAPARMMRTVSSCAGGAWPPTACAIDSRPSATAAPSLVAAQRVGVAAPTAVIELAVDRAPLTGSETVTSLGLSAGAKSEQ